MGFFRNVRHEPVNQASFGLAHGITYSPDINDIKPLGLLTLGFLLSDTFSDCPPVSTSFSACPTVSTSFSACPSVSTSWSLE